MSLSELAIADSGKRLVDVGRCRAQKKVQWSFRLLSTGGASIDISRILSP